jgi:hypothetical protein
MSLEAMFELSASELEQVAGGGVAPIRPCVNGQGVTIPNLPFSCGPDGFWASGSNYINGQGGSISIEGYQFADGGADLLGAALSNGIL